MKSLRTFLTVLCCAATVAHATIDYRPRTRKIEITADAGVITISFSEATPADIEIEARYARVRYRVPKMESRVLKGRAFSEAELRILPYGARQGGPKVESLQIVVHLPTDTRRGRDVYFVFRGDGVFSHTTVMDYDEVGSRPAKVSNSEKPNQSPEPTAGLRPAAAHL